ncbi:methylated-DNA--[protein]-cysteine S-methyltransferase [Thermus sp. PS18]|uniref:Methylated-DNA--[protein]-cysteine S-methyltransferase n=1 Tax=Thermus brevis TaxID=2862456 RepID=A0ABS6ZZ23_9DEIN|nr:MULTISPECIES: methylated-DNA--[protein]-cysteine S-methyltransferase [Thermus]MBW6395085.1 methylated-DNA--[protein]-cysteine S-methyltransferase [Thermus brevis]UZX15629.1 methylated-DNA--[protein]-cysteine S-methyltransferase [Thermus sp. PS18]
MLIPTPIGPLWLEVSPGGVRRLEPALFPRGLEARGPLAERVRERVLAYFAGEKPDFLDIPLDYTGFSPKRVALYERVRLIPYGHTESYGSLARELGLSPRAVGAGMRASPFFLLVPAHRVIHADGRLGGFAGQEGLKAWLLRFEGAWS